MNDAIQITRTPPKDTEFFLDVVCAIFVYKKEILLLQRHPEKRHGHCWGLPGGKRDAGETIAEAMNREVYEETKQLMFFDDDGPVHTTYVQSEAEQFRFHVAACYYNYRPEVVLRAEEHVAHAWCTLEQIQALPTVPGLKEHLKMFEEDMGLM